MASGPWGSLFILQFLVRRPGDLTHLLLFLWPTERATKVITSSRGIVNTFGVYQTYYQSNLLQNHSASEISWIGTFQGFLLVIVGILAGPIFDQGYLRQLLVVGTFLVTLGMMMTSIATEYWQIFLAQGVCVGLGAGCLFLPSIAVVATYFTSKRALATGVVASGGSVGSVIYPIVFHRLLPRAGFGWATRAIGFIAFATLLISIAITRLRTVPPKKSRRLFDASAFRSILFVLFSFGVFLAGIGLYIPFFYVIVYAQVKIHVEDNLSFYLLSILNAASGFGRIIGGLLADKFGSLEVMCVFMLASSILSYVWIAIDNLGGLVVFCILYGFFTGAVVSLPPTVVAKLVPNFQKLGTWMGMNISCVGFGFLIGNPIAGTLINIQEDRFRDGFIFAASAMMASSVVFILVGIVRLNLLRVSPPATT